MNEKAPGFVKSADRVLDVFELLAQWGAEMSHGDLVDALAIPKSSLSQLLANLVQRGYVDFSPATKGYRLGEAFIRLSRQNNESRSMVSIIQPILEDITKQTRETSALNQLRGNLSEVVATQPSPQRLATHMHTGDLAPLYATSGGKILLAHLPAQMRADYMREVTFEPITPATIRSKRELQRQVATAAEEGFACSYEEFTPGIIGVAVPLLGLNGFPLGSLNVAVPSIRFNDEIKERLLDVLKSAADRAQRLHLTSLTPRPTTR